LNAVSVALFMIGQNLEVVILFNSDKQSRTQEEKLKNKWLTRYKNAKSSTALIGRLVGHNDKEDLH